MISIEQAKLICKTEEQKNIAERLGLNDWTKYINEDQFLNEKLEIADILQLDQKKSLKILDIGAGIGHFGCLSKFYGHEYLGTYYGRTNQHTQHFFDHNNLKQVQCGFFPNYEKNIPAGTWDIILMLRTTFEINLEWSTEDWKEVYNVCMNNLNSGGQLLIKSNLTRLPTKKYGKLEYECVERLQKAFRPKESLPQWQWMTYHWIKD